MPHADPPKTASAAAALAPHRILALVSVLVAAVVLVGLGLRYAGHSGAGSFDRAVDGWLISRSNYRFALWCADLGNGPVVAILIAVTALGCLRLGQVRSAALMVLAPSVAASLAEFVIKPWVNRTKGVYLAYPSGHAAGLCAFAFAAIVVLMSASGERLPRRLRRLALGVAAAMVVLCTLGLVGADYHYATDVIGGACLALVSVLLLALLLDAVGDSTVICGKFGSKATMRGDIANRAGRGTIGRDD